MTDPIPTVQCACGWQRPLVAITRADGERPTEDLSVRYDCPACGRAHASGEIPPSVAEGSGRARRLEHARVLEFLWHVPAAERAVLLANFIAMDIALGLATTDGLPEGAAAGAALVDERLRALAARVRTALERTFRLLGDPAEPEHPAFPGMRLLCGAIAAELLRTRGPVGGEGLARCGLCGAACASPEEVVTTHRCAPDGRAYAPGPPGPLAKLLAETLSYVPHALAHRIRRALAAGR